MRAHYAYAAVQFVSFPTCFGNYNVTIKENNAPQLQWQWTLFGSDFSLATKPVQFNSTHLVKNLSF